MPRTRGRGTGTRAARIVAGLVALLLLLLLAARTAYGQARTPLDSVVPPSPAPDGFIADGGPVLDPAALALPLPRPAEPTLPEPAR